jgi:RNA polymerase sigma-70 factor (ECF subfamily)
LSDWLTDLLAGRPGSDAELVQRYSYRLLEFARRQLPECVRRREDPEDIVQSVYRSFFRRLQEGRFTFDDSQDVWRLLAAITYRKARNAVKFHQRDRRDVRRELPLPGADSTAAGDVPEPQPDMRDVETLFDCLDQLLAGLPENYRTIVVRRLEGESIEDIAQQVQRSRRTVLRVLAHVQELAARQLEPSA